MKQIRDFIIKDYYLDWEDQKIEISQMRRDLDELEKLGATHVLIEAKQEYYENAPDVAISSYSVREETDDEYSVRLKEEAKKLDAKNRQERLQYEKLKEKFDK